MKFTFDAIGVVHSPYKQKFAIPRQPGLINEARGKIELLPPYDHPDSIKGIDEFSHLWLTFIFHETLEQGWSNLVRPPRLGGNKKIGVFATRSTFRPNPIGLSVVKLHGIQRQNKKLFIDIGGLDLLDQTPILDIKPYIPYADVIEDPTGGYASEKPQQRLEVSFAKEARSFCQSVSDEYPELEAFISSLLAQDPRPAYKQKSTDRQEYAVFLYEFNVRWTIEDKQCRVIAIEPRS